MWSILGWFLLSWLGLGFISGVKLVYIDKYTRELIEKNSKDMNIPPDVREFIDALLRNNKAMLVAYTLLGYLSFMADTRNTFKKK